MTDFDQDVRSSMEWHRLELLKLLNISTLHVDNPTKSPKFNISQTYSGASNQTTKIEYTLSKETQVSIEVYDVNGKKLLRLVNEAKPAGKYDLSFNSSELPRGLYFCKMSTPMLSQTLKMILSH
jgi:hypothetical protein